MSVPSARRKPPAGELGRWLDGMLRSRRWSQADLARAMGIDGSMVSKWVRGARLPDDPHCQGIAVALGVPPYEVLALTGRLPALAFIPTSHPSRDRAHALIDVLDPVLIDLLLPLMEQLVPQPSEDPTHADD